jgi:hypothetical protein
MIEKLNVRVACNSLSLGQVGFNIVRELYKRRIKCSIFPYGGVDLSAYKVDPQFGAWLTKSVNERYTSLDRKIPTLNCWHLRDSELRLSDKQVTLSFHETDQPTNEEVNIVNQQDYTFFSSSWSVDNFLTFGAKNVGFVHLGLDPDFVPAAGSMFPPEVTHWICVGKWEDLRKMTGQKIATWIKRYGGNQSHQLTICVNNPFYQKRRLPDGRVEGFDMNDVYARLFGSADWPRAKPSNVNVLPHLKTNAEMASLYQSADIDLSGISRAEGYNLPAFTATAFGKWSIVTNCSAHKDWATAENSILIEPTGSVKAVDGFFFREGDQFSSGNMFDFAPDAIEEAMIRAEKLAKTPNPAGLELGKTLTYKHTVDRILDKIEEISV